MKQSVVVIKNIKKFFPSKHGSVKAVDGVNLQVASGEVFGFLGPNGAGKTTTLRILTTLLVQDSGDAFVAGFNVKKEPDQVRRHIGYVSQAGGADRPAPVEKILFYRVNFTVCPLRLHQLALRN